MRLFLFWPNLNGYITSDNRLLRESRACRSLTSGTTLFRFDAMHFPGMRKTLRSRQVISALALVFVFFLPFHFHFSIASQVTKECSCLQGTRTQLAPSASPPAIVPQLRIFQVADLPVSVWTEDESAQQHVRGPPSLASL